MKLPEDLCDNFLRKDKLTIALSLTIFTADTCRVYFWTP